MSCYVRKMIDYVQSTPRLIAIWKLRVFNENSLTHQLRFDPESNDFETNLAAVLPRTERFFFFFFFFFFGKACGSACIGHRV